MYINLILFKPNNNIYKNQFNVFIMLNKNSIIKNENPLLINIYIYMPKDVKIKENKIIKMNI